MVNHNVTNFKDIKKKHWKTGSGGKQQQKNKTVYLTALMRK